MQETVGLARLFLRLWRQAWPVLLLLATLGSIANELLLPLAVRLGYLNSLAGFAMLALLVLAKLVVTVLMFVALRPYLPAVSALQIAGASQQPDTPQPAGARAVIGLVALALVPFFAYYAAWGFLGDTVRDYSVRALSEAGFGEKTSGDVAACRFFRKESHGVPLVAAGRSGWGVDAQELTFLEGCHDFRVR